MSVYPISMQAFDRNKYFFNCKNGTLDMRTLEFREHRPEDYLTMESGITYLEAHPLCVQCAKQGKYVRATVVDHIIPHRGDQKLFWDQNNWQPLCKSCHDKKTLTEDINPTYTY